MHKILIGIFVFLTSNYANGAQQSDCAAFVAKSDNYKMAHTHVPCLDAAKGGSGPAQYSVGLSYGLVGDHEAELKFTEAAANNRVVAAYLALGNIYRKTDLWRAIYWYQRHVHANGDGWGYSASKLAQIFDSLGEKEQSKYWKDICEQSPTQIC